MSFLQSTKFIWEVVTNYQFGHDDEESPVRHLSRNNFLNFPAGMKNKRQET
jgi:hypothetical protein